ncbi:hypothetical protein NFI96_016428 [Prochilodus magdalenae]|nr:hypothetical protein NFI96_016428 [Prochilodus magdalenae]
MTHGGHHCSLEVCSGGVGSVRLLLPSCSSYSTSPVRLGVLQRVNEKYERFLEQRFPRFYILYHTLTRGFQLLLEDVKEVRRIKRSMRNDNIHHRALPYRDLERLILFRRDMIKAVPLLVISLPPFAIGLVFILMCLFPRYLLFRHFWTPQQQRKFQAIAHQKRSYHQAEVLKHVFWAVPRVGEWPSRTLLLNLCAKCPVPECPNVISRYSHRSRVEPTRVHLSSVLYVRSSPALHWKCSLWNQVIWSVYTVSLYTLRAVSRPALFTSHSFPPPPFYLLRSIQRSLGSQLPVIVWMPSFLVRRRLATKALDLLYLDRALDSLGLDQLSDDEMRRACDLRGLNPGLLSSSQCREWLQQWLRFSIQVKGPPQDHHRAGMMWVVDHSQHCSDTDVVVVC